MNNLRHWITLVEAIAYRGRGFNVIRNPSKAQYVTMCAGLKRLDSDEGLMRGLLDTDGTVYVWDAYYAEHEQISRSIGVAYGYGAALNFECDAHKVIFNYAENDAGSKAEKLDVQRLATAPALQRIFGTPVPVQVEHW
jgi:hypothetical protein